jgi:anti-sigma-K factor RskA
MSALTCSEIKELLPALALDALDPDERAAVTSHLDACPGCRAQFDEYRAVSEGLLGAAPQRTPPPALKASLMERAGAPPEIPLAAPQPRRAPAAERLRDWWRGAFAVPRWAFAAAAVVVVIAFGVLSAQVAQLTGEQRQLAARLATQQQALALLDAAGAATMPMTGTQVAPAATALLRYDPAAQVAVLQVRDLPAAGAAKSYQLWLIDADGKRDSGAVFEVPPDANGSTTVAVWTPRQFNGYVRCGISIEPRGGSPQPTGPAALAGKAWSYTPPAN